VIFRHVLLAAALVLVPSSLPKPVHAAANTAAPVAAASGSWTTYHHDNAHTGYDPLAPAAETVAPTVGWTETALDSQIYAEPLIYNGTVYAATLNNTVYALNQSTGAILWANHLGAPVSSGWQCGNVSPQGILGTPVIDVASGRVYAAALFSSDHLYHVFGLDLNTGNVTLATTIPAIIGAGFDWRIQQERGALAVANGYVYVPFGGRAGDCGSYNGWVVGVPTDGSASLNVLETPAHGSGVWDAGGVVVDDATGNVFVSTGNAVAGGCASVDQNDAVLRLTPTLTMADWFMPQDWQDNWCNNDQDLGSASPLLLSPNLMFQSGKWGGGFLLDPNALGGVDGQLFPTPMPASYSQAEVCLGNHSDATFGSFAYAAPFIYAECEGNGLVALNLNTGTRSFSACDVACAAPDWTASNTSTFGPPIVAGGAVWVAGDGSGLWAFDATTGAQIYHSADFGINRFATPSEAGGQVFVAAQTVIKSFSFGPPPPPPPTVISLTPNNGPTAGGTSVTITGTNLNGTTTVKFGTAAAATFSVISPTQITATSPPGSATVDVTVTSPAGTNAVSAADQFTFTLPPAAYTAVPPVRILDTRNGTGGVPVAPLGAGSSLSLTVAGANQLAPAGATAVMLNITVANTTAAGFLTVYPAGSALPLASSLNWAAGKTVPNLVEMQVGTGGAVTFYNQAGSTDVVVDLEGYFAPPSGSAGQEVALGPARISDTRAGSGLPNAGSTLGAGGSLDIQVTGAGAVPASGVSAAILNVTATNTTAASFLTVWPTGGSRPLASNLNWEAGQTVPNRVIVPVGTTGKISVYNPSGSVDVVIDVAGYFTDATATGVLFNPQSPFRIADTRGTATLGPGSTHVLQVGGLAGVPSTATAVVLNVTVTNTSASSFLAVYPSTATRPTASDLNWSPGQTVANMVVVTLSSTGAITFYNQEGSIDVVADIAGWFS
jgi:outer membrane protein assembly factor BamB